MEGRGRNEGQGVPGASPSQAVADSAPQGWASRHRHCARANSCTPTTRGATGYIWTILELFAGLKPTSSIAFLQQNPYAGVKEVVTEKIARSAREVAERIRTRMDTAPGLEEQRTLLGLGALLKEALPLEITTPTADRRADVAGASLSAHRLHFEGEYITGLKDVKNTACRRLSQSVILLTQAEGSGKTRLAHSFAEEPDPKCVVLFDCSRPPWSNCVKFVEEYYDKFQTKELAMAWWSGETVGPSEERLVDTGTVTKQVRGEGDEGIAPSAQMELPSAAPSAPSTESQGSIPSPPSTEGGNRLSDAARAFREGSKYLPPLLDEHPYVMLMFCHLIWVSLVLRHLDKSIHHLACLQCLNNEDSDEAIVAMFDTLVDWAEERNRVKYYAASGFFHNIKLSFSYSAKALVHDFIGKRIYSVCDNVDKLVDSSVTRSAEKPWWWWDGCYAEASWPYNHLSALYLSLHKSDAYGIGLMLSRDVELPEQFTPAFRAGAMNGGAVRSYATSWVSEQIVWDSLRHYFDINVEDFDAEVKGEVRWLLGRPSLFFDTAWPLLVKQLLMVPGVRGSPRSLTKPVLINIIKEALLTAAQIVKERVAKKIQRLWVPIESATSIVEGGTHAPKALPVSSPAKPAHDMIPFEELYFFSKFAGGKTTQVPRGRLAALAGVCCYNPTLSGRQFGANADLSREPATRRALELAGNHLVRESNLDPVGNVLRRNLSLTQGGYSVVPGASAMSMAFLWHMTRASLLQKGRATLKELLAGVLAPGLEWPLWIDGIEFDPLAAIPSRFVLEGADGSTTKIYPILTDEKNVVPKGTFVYGRDMAGKGPNLLAIPSKGGRLVAVHDDPAGFGEVTNWLRAVSPSSEIERDTNLVTAHSASLPKSKGSRQHHKRQKKSLPIPESHVWLGTADHVRLVNGAVRVLVSTSDFESSCIDVANRANQSAAPKPSAAAGEVDSGIGSPILLCSLKACTASGCYCVEFCNTLWRSPATLNLISKFSEYAVTPEKRNAQIKAIWGVEMPIPAEAAPDGLPSHQLGKDHTSSEEKR